MDYARLIADSHESGESEIMDTTYKNDELAVKDLVQAWARAVEGHDLDGALANHSPNITMFDVPVLQLLGIGQYRNSFEEFFKWLGPKGSFRLTRLEVVAGSDTAFCYGIVDCVGETAPSGLTVRLTVGLRKTSGVWTVVHEHHSIATP